MSTIKLFGKAFKQEGLPISTVNHKAMPLGYIVHPDCCGREVWNFLETQKINHNATFYKEWQDVTSKTRWELLIDQVIHYASTYGTDFEGEPYVPNEAPINIDYTKFKLILPITRDEAIERCEKMLGGMALKQETIEQILSVFKQCQHVPNLDLIKNKEALMFICVNQGIVPNDPVEMVRFIVYLATGKTLLIKDKATLEEIQRSNIDISKFNLEKLSTVFFRFKPIFLALKHNKVRNSSTVNRLRKLAEKNHVPMKLGLVEQVLNNEKVLPEFIQTLQQGKVSDIKKVQLITAIKIRCKELNTKVFPIRNGKMWVKEEKNKVYQYYGILESLLIGSLIESLEKKACDVYIPEGFNLTLPFSEKSYVGNVPIGSYINLSDSDCVVGIHWRGEEGARDLDLKLIDINGNQYGWNASYYNRDKTLVFSGDMTSANPEASELFYAKKGFAPSIVKVNLYSGEANSKFRFFLAKEPISTIQKGYMVNPNNILFQTECVMDSSEKSLGVITGDKFIFSQFRTGKGRVAGDSTTNKYTDYALSTVDCYLDARDILSRAGFTFSDKGKDLTIKDNLIGLLM